MWADKRETFWQPHGGWGGGGDEEGSLVRNSILEKFLNRRLTANEKPLRDDVMRDVKYQREASATAITLCLYYIS